VGSEISDNHRSDDASDAHAPSTVVDDALGTGILDQSLCENAELTTSDDISPESSVQLPEIQVQFSTMGIESLEKSTSYNSTFSKIWVWFSLPGK
jgi:hypothetical protein